MNSKDTSVIFAGILIFLLNGWLGEKVWCKMDHDSIDHIHIHENKAYS